METLLSLGREPHSSPWVFQTCASSFLFRWMCCFFVTAAVFGTDRWRQIKFEWAKVWALEGERARDAICMAGPFVWLPCECNATLPDASSLWCLLFYFLLLGRRTRCAFVCYISESKSTERVNRLSFHSTNHTLRSPFVPRLRPRHWGKFPEWICVDLNVCTSRGNAQICWLPQGPLSLLWYELKSSLIRTCFANAAKSQVFQF